MASLRALAQCIGLQGEFSVIQDFYGYLQGPPQPLSLTAQMKLLEGKHYGVNLIRVGIESWTPALQATVDSALHDARGIYAGIGLGIGRVGWYSIALADANGLEDVTSNCEAEELMDGWSVPNERFDVFLVLSFVGENQNVGYSGIDIEDKEEKLSGSVLSTAFDSVTVGFVLAHELGHALGPTGDYTDPARANELMYFQAPNGGAFSSDDCDDILDHVWVEPGCASP